MPEAFGGALDLLLLEDARNGRPAFAVNRGRLGRLWGFLIAVRTLAVGATAAGQLPCAVVDPAVLAGAAPCALWVVVGILVEGDGVHGVEVAEDVAAPSAVVPPSEVGEVPGTDCVVAHRRFGIRLRGRRC